MTDPQRADFWNRFHAEIERFRERQTDCNVTTNPFENKRWAVRFTCRRGGDPPAVVTLSLVEHQTSRQGLLLAVTPEYHVGEAVTEGERLLIPVLFDQTSNAFSLHADHGPVPESQMPEFFSAMARELLFRL